MNLPMDFIMCLNMDNAAFDDNVTQPLAEAFDNIVASVALGNQSGTILDTNGNTVGNWAIGEARPEE